MCPCVLFFTEKIHKACDIKIHVSNGCSHKPDKVWGLAVECLPPA